MKAVESVSYGTPCLTLPCEWGEGPTLFPPGFPIFPRGADFFVSKFSFYGAMVDGGSSPPTYIHLWEAGRQTVVQANKIDCGRRLVEPQLTAAQQFTPSPTSHFPCLLSEGPQK